MCVLNDRKTFLLGIVTIILLWSCQKEEPPKRNGTIIDYPTQIALDSGYSKIDFAGTTLAIYAPNSLQKYDNLIVAFPPTNGTNTLIRALVKHVADSLNALVLSPTWIENEYQYALMISSLISLDKIKDVPKYFVGYSAGGSDAFVEAQRLGKEKIKGLVLLAAGRGTNDFLNIQKPPLMKICFCTGTADFVYPANVQLYQDLLGLNKEMKFIEIEGFDHGDMFSTGYPEQIAECFNYVSMN